MNNLKSYTEYAVTAPTTDFVIGFDFNYGTDAVNITVDGIPATEAGYSVIYLNSTTMRLSPAVPTGVVRLQRETDIDVPDNQFTAGAKFTASNMDENFKQLCHAQQEVRDETTRTAEQFAILDANATVALNAANTAVNTANSIDAKATTALANSNTAVSTVNSANTAANTALSTANGVDAKATTALSNSSTALSTANTANTNANNSLKKSSNLSDLDSATTARTNLDVYSKSEVGTAISNAATPTATETVAGKAKIATTVIAQGGTNDTDFLTSKKLQDVEKFKSGLAVVLATGVISRSGGCVASCSKSSTGTYNITLSNPSNLQVFATATSNDTNHPAVVLYGSSTSLTVSTRNSYDSTLRDTPFTIDVELR